LNYHTRYDLENLKLFQVESFRDSIACRSYAAKCADSISRFQPPNDISEVARRLIGCTMNGARFVGEKKNDVAPCYRAGFLFDNPLDDDSAVVLQFGHDEIPY